MRNPFTVLKAAVSSLFKGRKPVPPVYSPKPQPAPISREEPRAHAPEPVQVIPWGSESRRKARNQRRRTRAEVRAFVRALNQGRG